MELRRRVLRWRCGRACQRLQLDGVQGLQRAALPQELRLLVWHCRCSDMAAAGKQLCERKQGLGVGLGLERQWLWHERLRSQHAPVTVVSADTLAVVDAFAT